MVIHEFDDLVKNGLVADIFKAEQAFHVMKAVGESAERVNNNSKKFGELFGTIQNAFQSEALLGLSRLFDRPSQTYPTRCIEGLLDYLVEHKDEFSDVREKPNVKKLLKELKINVNVIHAVDEREQFIIALSEHFLQRIKEPEVQKSVQKLKLLRDKVIAHNEVVHDVKGPTWGEFSALLNIAKELVGILGWAYMSTSYMYEDEYILDSDAQRSSRAMKRLITKLF